MSKKRERVKYLAGIYAALDEAEIGADGKCAYPKEKIKQVLETVKHLLAEDGIMPLES
ncbi:TPA: hypothetical protein ACSP3E_002330 [Aeromonas veronii]|uniref:hypothetical protein n=1 Tax=Aeromonas veronii TaxID=654 RepID=UPI0035B961AE